MYTISFLTVMPQRYAVEMHDEFVLKGNTAVLKCHVPGFVKEYVTVESWIKEPMENVDGSSKSGNISKEFSLINTHEL